MERPSSAAGTSELRENLDIIWRRKWIIVLCAVVITFVAVTATLLFNTPKYQSATELLQRRSGVDRALLGSDVLQQSSYVDPDRNMQTAAELVKSPEVVAGVEKRLEGELEGRNPVSMISVSLVEKTDIMRIQATDTDPQMAADVANAFAAEYITWRQKVDKDILAQARIPLEAQLQSMPAEQQGTSMYQVLADKLETLKLIEAMQTGNLELVKAASVSSTPVSRGPLATGIVAFFISIVVGIGLAYLLERLDTRLRSTEEITRRIDKPILATIPRITAADGSLVTINNPSGACAESFRLLKTNLSYIEPDSEIKSIMVTSPEPSEGKSTTIANLAVTMARAGQRVIIIEADLRRPVLSAYLGLDNAVGLTNAISGTCSLRETLQMIEAQDLVIGITEAMVDGGVAAEPMIHGLNGVKPIYCVTAGPIPPNPGELAASERMGALIAEACEYADVVLVDAPPLGVVGDASSIASKVDGVVVVMRIAQTSRKSIDAVQGFIETVPCNVLGLVVTNTKASGTHNGGYYYE